MKKILIALLMLPLLTPNIFKAMTPKQRAALAAKGRSPMSPTTPTSRVPTSKVPSSRPSKTPKVQSRGASAEQLAEEAGEALRNVTDTLYDMVKHGSYDQAGQILDKLKMGPTYQVTLNDIHEIIATIKHYQQQ